MDSDRFELATILVHLASMFGFITNIISLVTIKKCLSLCKHRIYFRFGIICGALAVNNSVVLVMNSVWYLMPDSGIFKFGSMASRAVGMV
ncbi:hypothetical protein PENTCL1PPCAC_16735, partial [Pristionchus entomophagus]